VHKRLESLVRLKQKVCRISDGFKQHRTNEKLRAEAAPERNLEVPLGGVKLGERWLGSQDVEHDEDEERHPTVDAKSNAQVAPRHSHRAQAAAVPGRSQKNDAICALPGCTHADRSSLDRSRL
jgi:hypothetical protein